MNRLEKLWKGLFLTLLIGTVITFSNCDDEEKELTPTQTILELVETTSGLDSLAKYLSVYPSLTAVLSGSTENTFFAPDNNAFISLLETPGFPANIASINPELIKGVLAYHISSGAKNEADLSGSLSTLYTDAASGNNQAIQFNSDGTLLTGSLNKNIGIKSANNLGTNGVMHIVESVLIPPSVGETLTPILGTLAGTVLLATDFTNLAEVLLLADSDVPTGEIPVTGYLSSEGTNGWTLFAPSNQIIAATNPTLPTTAADARAFILRMLVPGALASADFQNVHPLTSISGAEFTLIKTDVDATAPLGWAIVSNEGAAGIFAVDLPHGSSVLHVTSIY